MDECVEIFFGRYVVVDPRDGLVDNVPDAFGIKPFVERLKDILNVCRLDSVVGEQSSISQSLMGEENVAPSVGREDCAYTAFATEHEGTV